MIFWKEEFPLLRKIPIKAREDYIKDYFIRFWFRFIFPYQGYIEFGNEGWVLQKIKDSLNEFISYIFEDICRELLPEFTDIIFNKCGSYWDKNTEIDIVAINEQKCEIIFGECKWRSQKVTLQTLNELRQKAQNVDWQKNNRTEYYVLFSKNGFCNELQGIANNNKQLMLIDFREVKQI